GLRRPSRHRGTAEGGRRAQGEAGGVWTLRGAGDAHALRAAPPAPFSRPQRTHRREVLTMADDAAHRTLTLQILRFNPQEPGSTPRMQPYQLEEADGMTLFIALNEIREKQDPSLQFDFVCRAGICGSCAMVINGRPTLACRTLTKNLGPGITLAPLPFFELIGDLSVDTGKWMRGMSERLEGWLHMKDPDPDLRRMEEKMDPDLADK